MTSITCLVIISLITVGSVAFFWRGNRSFSSPGLLPVSNLPTSNYTPLPPSGLSQDQAKKAILNRTDIKSKILPFIASTTYVERKNEFASVSEAITYYSTFFNLALEQWNREVYDVFPTTKDEFAEKYEKAENILEWMTKVIAYKRKSDGEIDWVDAWEFIEKVQKDLQYPPILYSEVAIQEIEKTIEGINKDLKNHSSWLSEAKNLQQLNVWAKRQINLVNLGVYWCTVRFNIGKKFKRDLNKADQLVNFRWGNEPFEHKFKIFTGFKLKESPW